MKTLEKLHKIPDIYIIYGVALGLCIILIYFIVTLLSLKLEVQLLNDKIDGMGDKQKQIISTTIREEFVRQENIGNVFINEL